MVKKPNEYPLVWPQGWGRTPGEKRKRGKFLNGRNAITYFAAEKRVLEELKRLVVLDGDVICSSNMIRDRQPTDPGVAVYFQGKDKPQRVIAVDIYNRVEDNLAAIAATVEAMRAIDRHGGAQILERAFTGFDALPAPKKREPWEVLGISKGANEDQINTAWRNLQRAHHPDTGDGNAVAMSEATDARDAMLQARRSL